MALVFFDGFDNCNALPKPEWAGALPWQLVTAGRNGHAATISGANNLKTIALPSTVTTLFCGFALNLTQDFFGASDAGFPVWLSGGTTRQACVSMDASGHFQFRTGGTGFSGTTVATSAYSLPINTFVYVQVKLVASLTVGNVIVKVNNVEVINFTGQTVLNSTAINSFGFSSSGSGATSQIDDLWVCDSTDGTATDGRPNNDFLGDLKVATLLPDGPGAITQWTPSSAVANWTCVDEQPVNTTDYVTTSVLGNRDLYTVSDLPAGASAVYGLRVGAYAQKTDAGVASVKLLHREPGGTIVAPTTTPGLGTAFGYTYAPMVKIKSDNSLWTPTDVNGMQVGVEAAG